MSQIKDLSENEIDFLKSFFSKVSFEQKTSYKYITKQHFDKWRNYTLNQIKLKMMRNMAILEEVFISIDTPFYSLTLYKYQIKKQKAKNKILQQAYSSFGTILVIGFFLFVLYYNYLMFERYLVPL